MGVIMSSAIRPAGIPSQRVRPTEAENSSWYNVIGNRNTAHVSTAHKVKERATRLFSALSTSHKVDISSSPKVNTRSRPSMYTKEESLHLDHDFGDGTRAYAATARVNLARFRSDDRPLYLLELESDGLYYGDLIPANGLLGQPDVKHNPGTYPSKEGGVDRVSFAAQFGNMPRTGSAEWTIPVYVLRFNRAEPTLWDVDTTDQTVETMERFITESQGEVIAKIDVVQRFALENFIITASKGGVDLGSVDIRQI